MRMTPDLHETHEVHTHPSLAVIVSISSPVWRKSKDRSHINLVLTVFRVRVFSLQLHAHTLLGSSLLIRP